MALVGFDIGRAVKWGVIGVLGLCILSFIYSWYNRGVDLDRTQSQLKAAREEVTELNNRLEEHQRISDLINKLDARLEGRQADDALFFDRLSKNYDLGVQAELAREAEAAKEAPPSVPQIKVETTQTTPRAPATQTITVKPQVPLAPAPTPAPDNIGTLSIDAAWQAYCHAVNYKAENCKP